MEIPISDIKKELKVVEGGKYLHLGCQRHHLDWCENVDYVDWPEVDTVHDLNKSPWPWRDNSVDGIIMIHVLEHLDYYKAMNEMGRILKPKGRAYIIVPHFTNHRAHIGEHVHKGFSWVAFEHFADPNHPFYGFKVTRNTIDFGKKLNPLTRVINKFPMVYERFFAYLIPAVQVIVTLSLSHN